MRTVRFELLRPQELIAERERLPLVFLPVGPLEWHSYHLPYGTDPLNAEGMARRVAERTGGVVLPTLYLGTERERIPEKLVNLGFSPDDYIVGMDFPTHPLPSLYAPEELFALVVRFYLEQMVSLGYRLIVMVNGHGGRNHLEVLNRLCKEFSARTPAKVMLVSATPLEVKRGAIGHADAVETSMMMTMYPDTVSLGNLPTLPDRLEYNRFGIVDSKGFGNQPVEEHYVAPDSDPRINASAQRGEQIIADSVEILVEQVLVALNNIKL